MSILRGKLGLLRFLMTNLRCNSQAIDPRALSKRNTSKRKTTERLHASSPLYNTHIISYYIYVHVPLCACKQN